MKRYHILLIIAVLLFFSLSTVNYNVLILKNINSNELVYIERITPGDEFTMEWMHSVELQPWEEIFRVDDNYNIILDRTRFKSFGAGVPDYAGNETVIEDGYVIFKGINQKIDNITYGVSSFAKHTFYYKDKKLELYKFINDTEGVNISISNMNIIYYYITKASKDALLVPSSMFQVPSFMVSLLGQNTTLLFNR